MSNILSKAPHTPSWKEIFDDYYSTKTTNKQETWDKIFDEFYSSNIVSQEEWSKQFSNITNYSPMSQLEQLYDLTKQKLGGHIYMSSTMSCIAYINHVPTQELTEVRVSFNGHDPELYLNCFCDLDYQYDLEDMFDIPPIGITGDGDPIKSTIDIEITGLSGDKKTIIFPNCFLLTNKRTIDRSIQFTGRFICKGEIKLVK